MWKYLPATIFPQRIPVINVHGIINQKLTERVFKRIQSLSTHNLAALAVSVNSRGGLPVQSYLIADKIKSFAQNNNIKVYTFASDYAASGGYMVLSAGHEVFADRTSLVGSIGVLMARSNLKGLKEKADFEYVTYSSNKNSLYDIFNPFVDLTEEDRKKLQSISDSSHQKFINMMKSNRGNKLNENNKQIFSAQVFSGKEGLQNGLVDGLGSISQVMGSKFPSARLQFEDRRPFIMRIVAN